MATSYSNYPGDIDQAGGDYLQHARQHERMIQERQQLQAEEMRQAARALDQERQEDRIQGLAGQLQGPPDGFIGMAQAAGPFTTATTNVEETEWQIAAQTVTPGQIQQVQDGAGVAISGGSPAITTSGFLQVQTPTITADMMDEYAELRMAHRAKEKTFMGWLEAKYA